MQSILENLANEKTRTIYSQHGVTLPIYGVSFGHLRPLAKEIGIQHQLALELWDTHIFEACVLSTLIADPRKTDNHLLGDWVKNLNNRILADEFARFVSRTILYMLKMEAWIFSTKSWKGRCGWQLVAHAAAHNERTDDSKFKHFLDTIEADASKQPAPKQEAMNSALIAIGIRSRFLWQYAAATAERIKSTFAANTCKIPDAQKHMHQIWANREKMMNE